MKNTMFLRYLFIAILLFISGCVFNSSQSTDLSPEHLCQLEEVSSIDFEPYERLTTGSDMRDFVPDSIEGDTYEISFLKYYEGSDNSNINRLIVSSHSAFFVKWNGDTVLTHSISNKDRDKLNLIIKEFQAGNMYNSCSQSRSHSYYEYFSLKFNGLDFFSVLSKNEQIVDISDLDNKISALLENIDYLKNMLNKGKS